MAYLDKKLVAFGTVLEGMDVVYMIDKCGTAKGVPKWYAVDLGVICSKVVIADSGELPKTATTAPIPEGFFVPPSLRDSRVCLISTTWKGYILLLFSLIG